MVNDSDDKEALYFTDFFVAYLQQIQNKGYNHIRRTRPDGNCFYRAFAYSYFDSLLNSGSKDEFNRFRVIAEKSKELLKDAGFPEFTTEDFYEVVRFLSFFDIAVV